MMKCLLGVSLITVLVVRSLADPLDACVGQPNGAFVNNPADCQSFWICNNGSPIGGRCPNGYNFAEKSTLCELPEDFPCGDTVEPPPSTTEQPPPPLPSDSDACLNHPDGHFVNNPINCQAYWICHGTVAYTAACRDGLNFNEAAQLCDNPENFPCDDNDVTTTETPTTTPQPGDNDDFRCPTSGIALFPIADSCTQFRFCFAGFLSVRECAVGLHFDERLNRCNFEEKADCTRGLCPEQNDPANVVTHPSRSSCEDFYICLDGKPKQFSCAPGLHWSQPQRHCDFPINVNCKIVTPPPTTQAPPVIECPAATVEGLHIIAHPFDCARFFICSLGEPFEQVCPDDLKFDPSVGTCNKPDRFECFAE